MTSEEIKTTANIVYKLWLGLSSLEKSCDEYLKVMKFNHETGEHFEIDGAEIYVEETGNENAPVLLFLHGGFGNIEDFNSILSLFENEFRVVGIDSRGQGKRRRSLLKRVRKFITGIFLMVLIPNITKYYGSQRRIRCS